MEKLYNKKIDYCYNDDCFMYNEIMSMGLI